MAEGEGERSDLWLAKELSITKCSFCRHSIKLKEAKEEDSVSCSRCSQQIIGDMYSCTWVDKGCNFHAHRGCFKFKSTLENVPIHPQHHLSFVEVGNAGGSCFACTNKLFKGQICYACSKCGILVELKCTNLPDPLLCRAHEHPLDFYYVNDKGEVCIKKGNKRPYKQNRYGDFFRHNKLSGQSCAGCLLPLSGQVYCCAPCNFWIHKSCTDFPQEISDHPFHPARVLLALDQQLPIPQADQLECTPTHLVVLHQHPPYPGGKFKCGACGRRHSDGIIYHCDDCSFTLDIQCALLRGTIRKSGLLCPSGHELTFFNDTGVLCPCQACQGLVYDSPVYRCVPCNYNLHESCLSSLPVKHETHPHQLHFHKDKDSTQNKFQPQDYICSSCSIKIDWYTGAYLCSNCNYALHLHCVVIQDCKEEVKPKTKSVATPTTEDETNDNIAALVEKLKAKRIELSAYTRLLKDFATVQKTGTTKEGELANKNWSTK